MSQTTQTTDDVMNTLENALDAVEVTESDLVDGVQALVPEDEAGSLFGTLRRAQFDYQARRDPSGENIVVQIEADRTEQSRLQRLFS